MRVHVAFLPSLVLQYGLPVDSEPPASGPDRLRRQVCMVVDVIRASTSLVTLVERGATPIYIASDVASARAAAASRDGVVLAGEEDGLAPAGFNYGNSPVELSGARVAGRPVIFVTTNGTAAIRAVEGAAAVLVGALRNGTAVCREAWQTARQRDADVTIVCAGREKAFGMDDAYCAGYLVDRLLELGPAELTDGTQTALRLYRAEPDARALFQSSAAGQNVIRLGLAHDVEYCAQRDTSSAVPRLGREIFLLPS